MNNTANHNVSIPAFATKGAKIGTSTKIIEKQSKTNPLKKVRAIKSMIITFGEISKPVMAFSINVCPPLTRKTPENMIPPTIINMIMEVVFRVYRMDLISNCKLNFL
jgi:hypothetical protein